MTNFCKRCKKEFEGEVEPVDYYGQKAILCPECKKFMDKVVDDLEMYYGGENGKQS